VSDPLIEIFPDDEALARAAAEAFVAAAGAAVQARGAFHVALAGGSTPRRLHTLLAGPAFRDRVDWARVHIWFGDERCVPPEHPDSNYGMAKATLLDRVPIPALQVHPMRVSLRRLWHSAAEYAQTLAAAAPRDATGLPRLDLVLLGMGSDGHTASLFPGTCGLHAERPAAPVYVPRLGSWRLTLTFPVLNAAREVLFVVSGADKAEAAWRVLRETPGPQSPPAQRVRPLHGRQLWYLDSAAAAKL
jgi:6-phosphogluconolactonase